MWMRWEVIGDRWEQKDVLGAVIDFYGSWPLLSAIATTMETTG